MAFCTASVIPYGFSLLLSFVTGTPGFAAPRPAPAAPPCGAPPRLPCDNNSPSSVPNKLTAAASPPIKPRRVTFFGSILGPPYHPRNCLSAAFYASEVQYRERFLFSNLLLRKPSVLQNRQRLGQCLSADAQFEDIGSRLNGCSTAATATTASALAGSGKIPQNTVDARGIRAI